jgi:L-fucose isomerase-like protein
VDWNNNYGGDDDKCVLFHCGNWAKTFLPDIKIANAPILGSTLGVENTYGALEGRTPAGAAHLWTHDDRRQPRRHPRLCRRRPI